MRAHPRRCGEHGYSCPLRASLLGSSRRCGEHLKGKPAITIPEGSSPQVRGTLSVRADSTPPNRAHPRRCGEHLVQTAHTRTLWGSSPQVRGTSIVSESVDPILGLIPAGAGNMLRGWCRGGGGGAHPRRCGEHLTSEQWASVRKGSSPQVRGTSRFGNSRQT